MAIARIHHYVSFQGRQEASHAQDFIAQQGGFEQIEVQDCGAFFRVDFSSAEILTNEEQHAVLRGTKPDKTFSFNRGARSCQVPDKNGGFSSLPTVMCCTDCGNAGVMVHCTRCRQDFCEACLIGQPLTLSLTPQLWCAGCASQVPGAVTERGSTAYSVRDKRIGMKAWTCAFNETGRVTKILRWSNGYEYFVLTLDTGIAFGDEPQNIHFLNEQKTEVPMTKQTQNKPGIFSRFSGRSQSQPAEMNYDDLYLEDDTESSSGSLAPGAIDLKFPPRGQKLNTSNMTQEQLRTRRTNIIEGSKFGRPAHESFMLFLLRFWLLVGPIAFVLLTTSEVAYILTSLTAPGDKSTLIITGGALFIDLAMMFTTFGVAIKRRDQAEKREANGGVLAKREEAEVWFGTALWLIFAAINIIGQSAFLLHIISASGARDMTILYIFVASRVVGFILGDASTAFFLAGVDNSHLKLIARGEREKASLYSDISKAEGERRLIEAKAEADIILLEIKVQQERDDALFLADLKKQAFSAALGDRPQLSPPADPTGPNKSRLRRLDSN